MKKTNKLIRIQTIDTPTIFGSFRGSTSAFALDGKQAFIVHMVSKKNHHLAKDGTSLSSSGSNSGGRWAT